MMLAPRTDKLEILGYVLTQRQSSNYDASLPKECLGEQLDEVQLGGKTKKTVFPIPIEG